MAKIAGVYTITNLIDNKIYVGCTDNIKKRWRTHKRELKKGIHHGIRLQRAWNKYGEENFKFEILVECEINHLLSEEHYWATMLNVHNTEYGYNTQPTSPNGKRGHAAETIEKIRQKAIGRKWKPEDIEKRSKTNIGRKASEETKRKMSIGISAARKRWEPDSERQKQANISRSKKLKGRIFTEEHKRKIGEANKRRSSALYAEIAKKSNNTKRKNSVK